MLGSQVNHAGDVGGIRYSLPQLKGQIPQVTMVFRIISAASQSHVFDVFVHPFDFQVSTPSIEIGAPLSKGHLVNEGLLCKRDRSLDIHRITENSG